MALTGSAAGCANPRYRFWQYVAATNIWTMLQDYSPAASFTVATNGYTVGSYTFAVTARDQSSSAERDADVYVAYTLAAQVCASAGLTISPSTSAGVGTTLTLTGSSTGCAGTPQYRYWQDVVATNTWTVVRDYSASTSASVPTTGFAAGSYTYAVTVRGQGSNAEREKDVNVAYTLQ